MTDVRVYTFQREGQLVVTDQPTLDDAQATGRWIRYDGGARHG